MIKKRVCDDPLASEVELAGQFAHRVQVERMGLSGVTASTLAAGS